MRVLQRKFREKDRALRNFKTKKPLISRKIDKPTIIILGLAAIAGTLVLSSTLDPVKRVLSHHEAKKLCRKNHIERTISEGTHKLHSSRVEITKIGSGIQFGKLNVIVTNSKGVKKTVLGIGDKFRVPIGKKKRTFRLLSTSGTKHKFCVY